MAHITESINPMSDGTIAIGTYPCESLGTGPAGEDVVRVGGERYRILLREDGSAVVRRVSAEGRPGVEMHTYEVSEAGCHVYQRPELGCASRHAPHCRHTIAVRAARWFREGRPAFSEAPGFIGAHAGDWTLTAYLIDGRWHASAAHASGYERLDTAGSRDEARELLPVLWAEGKAALAEPAEEPADEPAGPGVSLSDYSWACQWVGYEGPAAGW